MTRSRVEGRRSFSTMKQCYCRNHLIKNRGKNSYDEEILVEGSFPDAGVSRILGKRGK